MSQANIDALLAEIASIKESLRIKNQSLANVNPNYQMNAAFIASLKKDIALLNTNLTSAQASLASATVPIKIKPTRANLNTTPFQGSPTDEEGNINPGWILNPDTGEFTFVGIPVGQDNPVVDLEAAFRIEESGEPEAQLPIDDGSDPYFSNGESTIPISPEPQKTPAENTPTGPAYDDAGFLMPGWSLDEENNPVWVGDNADGTIFVEPATQVSAQTSFNSYTALKADTQSKATKADADNQQQLRDWRVKLSLAPGSEYLYNAKNPGILLPLQATKGVLFPYTPQVSVTYAATYNATDLVHSNYKIQQYSGSSVDNINISCEFTAQDTFEANYLLAVIHFFKSVTKMFYGQDQKPNIGSPPPLCYLSGLGTFQFDNHPLAITSFTYTLPNDVDYIRATNTTTNSGVNKSAENVPDNSSTSVDDRKSASGLNEKDIGFKKTPAGTIEPTYVPTKMTIQITAVPIISRNDISNRFSLADYASGKLLRGKTNSSGGIW